jgi:methionyl-tRNA formyltransferase
VKVVFFGGLGAYSARHLEAIAATHRVVGTICGVERRGPRAAVGRLLRSVGLRSDPCGAVCRRRGIPRWFADRDGARAAALVDELRPDVIGIAGYPWLLPATVWTRPPLGAFNSHASLLPRHRGVLPLFWIYYHDDRETGVTVHRVTDGADAGDIVAQTRFPLARGLPVDRLSELNAEHGSRLLAGALDAAQAGELRAAPQDDGAVTYARRVAPGTPMLDRAWDVERVWHFLAGLCPRFVEPLRDTDGRRVAYRAVCGYDRAAHDRAAGMVRRIDGSWRLYCNGGVIHLA